MMAIASAQSLQIVCNLLLKHAPVVKMIFLHFSYVHASMNLSNHLMLLEMDAHCRHAPGLNAEVCYNFLCVCVYV